MIHVVLLKIVKLPQNITLAFFLKSLALIAISLSVVSCAETELIVQTAKQLSRNMEENRLDKKGVSPEVPAGYKLGKPYTVAGIKYFPRFDPELVEEGIASWYGEPFHGRDTANGEIYDMNALTAAHKTIPLPSTVRVTNLDNGRKLLLRVNDRGPFVAGRIIDVSRRGAQLLGFFRKGTTKVKIEFIELAPLKKGTGSAKLGKSKKNYNSTNIKEKLTKDELIAIPTSPIIKRDNIDLERLLEPSAKDNVSQTNDIKTNKSTQKEFRNIANVKGMFVQVGAFKKRSNAVNFAQKLNFISQSNLSTVKVEGATLYRVRIGPMVNLEGAHILLRKIIDAGYSDAHVIVVQ